MASRPRRVAVRERPGQRGRLPAGLDRGQRHRLVLEDPPTLPRPAGASRALRPLGRRPPPGQGRPTVTTYVAFCWGFDSCAVASLTAAAAWACRGGRA